MPTQSPHSLAGETLDQGSCEIRPAYREFSSKRSSVHDRSSGPEMRALLARNSDPLAYTTPEPQGFLVRLSKPAYVFVVYLSWFVCVSSSTERRTCFLFRAEI